MAELTAPGAPRHRVKDGRVAAAVVGATALVVAGSAAQLIDYAFFHLRIGVLDSSDDGGVFGVVGDLAVVSAAAGAWLLLIRSRSTVLTVALPVLLTFLSIDKLLRLHDHIPRYLLVYFPVLAGTLVCVVGLCRRLPRSLARLMTVGLVLLAGSFALHVFGEPLLQVMNSAHLEWLVQVKVTVKHGCEVEGWFLIAIALFFSASRVAEAGTRIPGASPGP